MLLSLSNRVLFILLAAPFCWRFSFTVKCLVIPSSLQNCKNLFILYSLPPLLLKYLIFLLVRFSTSVFHSLNLVKTSDFSLIK
ncbi:hypothetical protein RchiOBHm_Chr5g0024001 [Rosa chinensis]|uniref:Uncharacterized protein n=1 Tax=Rosa chinensis TaxID=74649 RepID=A0A2P6Q869_ROSCH|nr:hypothetical protein RchiOBHm_Chr5g0024001 [Rosa chinensis]